MRALPEGVAGYPRWQGRLAPGPMFPVIAAEEIRRAWRNPWAQVALVLVVGYAVVFLTSVQTLSQGRGGAGVHTMDTFLRFLELLPWGALAIAAIMAGPALLEDRRQGALELYLARAVTRVDYLLGKVLAVFGLSTLSIVAAGLVYWVGALLLFEQQPPEWNRALPGILVYALLWGALVTGLGLGLSAVTKSSRGATLLLFGSFAVADIFVTDPLKDITREQALQILSPFRALAAQNEWIFGVPRDFGFASWWGLAAWGLLMALGWGVLAWKHPRLAGAERGRA